MTSYKELQQTQHIESHTCGFLRRNSVERNFAQLDGWRKSTCLALSRQREIEGEVDILDIDYLIKEIVPGTAEAMCRRFDFRLFGKRPWPGD